MKRNRQNLTNLDPSPVRQVKPKEAKPGATFKGPASGRVSLLTQAIQHALS